MLRNKTAIESWNILKYQIESIIDQFIPLKKQGKQSRKLLKKLRTSKQCGGFIYVPERIKITHNRKQHLMQLQMKRDNL